MIEKKKTKNYEDCDFKFTLYYNENIVCQRYFNIPNFNSNVLYSEELKEMLESICGNHKGYNSTGLITDYLKKRSETMSWQSHNPFDDVMENRFEKNDEFRPLEKDEFRFEFMGNVSTKLEEKLGYKRNSEKRVLAETVFSGQPYHKYAKSNININYLVYNIIGTIVETCSLKKYNLV
jgi:hypothetical protein